jgi:hypothetical protein
MEREENTGVIPQCQGGTGLEGLAGMATPARLEVHLELEVGGEPIRGRISAEGTPSRSFTGWLELTSRLVDLINGATAGTNEEPSDPALHR